MSSHGLPTELVQAIVEDVLPGALQDYRRWVAQDLALVSRAVYTWVIPELFAAWYVPEDKLREWREHIVGSSSAARTALRARALIVNIPSYAYGPRRTVDPASAVRWDVPMFEAAFSFVHTALAPLKVLSALCSSPLFRPRRLFLLDYDLDTLVRDRSPEGLPTYRLYPVDAAPAAFPALSQLSHLFLQDIHDLLQLPARSTISLALPLPALTHIVIARFDHPAGNALWRLPAVLALLPRLQHILLGLAYDRTSLVQNLAELRDPRIFFFDASLVRGDGEAAAFTVQSARLDRDGADIWTVGTSALSAEF